MYVLCIYPISDALLIRWKGAEEALGCLFAEQWSAALSALSRSLRVTESEKTESHLKRGLLAFKGSFQREGMLGKGAFGTVYSVRRKGEDVVLAAKLMNRKAMEAMDDGSLANTIIEVNLLRRIDHPYIVRFVDAFESPNTICLGVCLSFHSRSCMSVSWLLPRVSAICVICDVM